MSPLELLELKIARLRFRGYGGMPIKPHRSIYHMTLHRSDLLLAVSLPLALNFLLFYSLDLVMLLWRGIFAFWLERLMPQTSIAMHAVDLGSHVLWLPIPDLSAGVPDLPIWLGTLVGCLVLFIATYFISPERFLPLKYIVRACLLIQATALLFFYLVPGRFPYDLVGYVADALTMALFFLFMIPWILGLTYYVFNFPLLQKLSITALIFGYFLLVLPMQYLFHAYFLHHASLLFLPMCYLIFGVFMDVMMLVAFYSWGMSWRFSDRSLQKRAG